MARNEKRRLPRLSRGTVFRGALLAVASVLLVVPAASYGGKKGVEKTSATSQLQVFSWWTGGGEAHGLEKLIAIWNKQHPVLTRKDFMGCYEIGYYGWKEGAGHQFFGPNNALDLWPVKKINPQSMIHLTEKPVELVARAMNYSSRPGENVLDLFGEAA